MEFFRIKQMEVGNNTNLGTRSLHIFSTDQYLEIELKYIRSCFNKRNGYPHWAIYRVLKEIKEKHQENIVNQAMQTNIKCPRTIIVS